MPRIDRSAVRRERRRSSPVAKRSGGLKIVGAYALLLEQERVYGGEPDPRWAYSEAGKRGDPYPESARGPALLLPAMEAGEPVQVSDSRLSALLRRAGSLGQFLTPQRPDGRVEQLFWDVWRDRSIGGLLVYSDDMVVPVLGGIAR
ncbi:hypothetical protein MB901379_03582 [Mycobacterium basiliense]|uniref:Uncharacterized protein n=1 Tax=Mycobacterium basiliense TaxID=2094119 RepID=A0A447GHY1_9MYCO|nr:hypothetical protein [Mycobacterium basiliense]VDM89989.1 hypothetical protein MB901379_03582 [Mycobacterium basiliense]